MTSNDLFGIKHTLLPRITYAVPDTLTLTAKYASGTVLLKPLIKINSDLSGSFFDRRSAQRLDNPAYFFNTWQTNTQFEPTNSQMKVCWD